MTVEMVTETIQIIIAPVVMVTACALLVNGLLNRYAVITNRLRVLCSERLDLLVTKQSAPETPFLAERLSQIDTQIPLLLRHHKLAHDAVVFVYFAVAVYIADMFIIALEATIHTTWLATAVLLIFLIATGILFVGIMLTAWEVRTSHSAIHYEVTRIAEL